MSFRTVSITKRCKLETQLNYLVVRADTETRILIDEISVLIVANTQCSMTAACISKLLDHKVKIIFCDSQWNPQAEVVGYHDHYAPYGVLKKQLSWTKELSDRMWNQIIRNKLYRQSWVLSSRGYVDVARVILEYADNVSDGDVTNREGLAAKLYFETLFGLGFNRRDPTDIKNVYLNYGYSVILSCVNRELSAAGYLLQLGIHHIGESNPFNLGCDLVEPIRPFVDEILLDRELTIDNYKKEMVSVLQTQVSWSGRTSIMENAIHSYVRSVLSALENNDVQSVSFIRPLKDEQL